MPSQIRHEIPAAAATQLFAADATRHGLIILTNRSAAALVHVGLGADASAVDASKGVPLVPGREMVIDADESAGAIYAISDTACIVTSSYVASSSAARATAGTAADPGFVASASWFARVEIARPADTTAYAAGDVVGGVIAIPDVGAASIRALITQLALRINVAAVPAGMGNFRLKLYKSSPPSALADNAAWDLPAGDRAAYVGEVSLGAPVDRGSTLEAPLQVGALAVVPMESTSLYAYLVTDAAYTPTASAVKVLDVITARL